MDDDVLEGVELSPIHIEYDAGATGETGGQLTVLLVVALNPVAGFQE
jgi:hypothetical protein